MPISDTRVSLPRTRLSLTMEYSIIQSKLETNNVSQFGDYQSIRDLRGSPQLINDGLKFIIEPSPGYFAEYLKHPKYS
jgi:hypothetical protein